MQRHVYVVRALDWSVDSTTPRLVWEWLGGSAVVDWSVPTERRMGWDR